VGEPDLVQVLHRGGEGVPVALELLQDFVDLIRPSRGSSLDSLALGNVLFTSRGSMSSRSRREKRRTVAPSSVQFQNFTSATSSGFTHWVSAFTAASR
jgi:hypothetical protein